MIRLLQFDVNQRNINNNEISAIVNHINNTCLKPIKMTIAICHF